MRRTWIVWIISLLLAACSSSPAVDSRNDISTPEQPIPTLAGAAGQEADAEQETAAEVPSPLPTDTLAPSATATPSPTTPPTHTPTPTNTPAPTIGAGSVMIGRADLQPVVFVPAGEFLMGAGADDQDADADEGPQHTVRLDAFWVDQYEVSNAAYDACVTAGACTSPAETDYNGNTAPFLDPGYSEHPVVNVSWEQARDYCDWVGKRLPTEAEWEKAARGLSGQRYAWGMDAPAGHLANLAPEAADDGYARTAPVGSFPKGASPFGALDMAGNVLEWAADWYAGDTYAISPAENPTGPAAGGYRVVRGAGFASTPFEARVTYRQARGPQTAWQDVGFRCVMADSRERLVYVGQPTETPLPPTITPTPTATPAAAQWALELGGISDIAGLSLIPTADGGLLALGKADGAMWVVKLDAAQNIAWQRLVGGENEWEVDVVELPGGGYVLAGGIGKDIWLAHLSADGQTIWQKTYGDKLGIDRSVSLAAVQDGFADANLTFGDKEGVVISWFDLDGEIVWQQFFSLKANYSHDVFQVQIDSDGAGGLMVWGILTGRRGLAFLQIDPQGALVGEGAFGYDSFGMNIGGRNFEMQLSAAAYAPALNGFVLGGSLRYTGGGGGGGPTLVALVQPDGKLVWQKLFSDPISIRDLKPYPGGVLLAGAGDREVFAWYAALSATGGWQWQQTIGADTRDIMLGAAVGLDGSPLYIGTYTCGDRRCVLLLKTDASGNIPGCDLAGSTALTLSNFGGGGMARFNLDAALVETAFVPTIISNPAADLELTPAFLCAARP